MVGDDEEVIYELESTSIIIYRYNHVGDFNDKFRQDGKAGEEYIEKYDISKRDDKGDRIATVVEAINLFVGNSWLWKKSGRGWI